MRSRRQGFTLVELLVVITVIVVLLAVLLPALGSAKESAKFVICQSNIRQLGVAGLAYTTDNRAKFPDAKLWVPTPVGVSEYHAWHTAEAVTKGLLWPYTSNPSSYLCESFKATYTRGVPFQCGGELNANLIKPAFSSTMNAYLGWSGWLTPTGSPLTVAFAKLHTIKAPTRTFFFGEENAWPQTSPPGAYAINNGMLGWRRYAAPNYYSPDLFATFHKPPGGDVTKGSSSAVFIDGHTQRVWDHQTQAYGYDPLW